MHIFDSDHVFAAAFEAADVGVASKNPPRTLTRSDTEHYRVSGALGLHFRAVQFRPLL